jgi:gentisate 1,2-dioxygenase
MAWGEFTAALESTSIDVSIFVASVRHNVRSFFPLTPGKPMSLAPPVYYDYARAARPELPGTPLRIFAPIATGGMSAFLPWDCAAELGASGPATTPALLAGHIRVRRGGTLVMPLSIASSRVLFVISGSGQVAYESHGAALNVKLGPWDVLCLPSLSQLSVAADQQEDMLLAYADDSPLLRHLGATSTTPTFPATVYRRDEILAEISRYRQEPGADTKNRLGSILGNVATLDAKTITPSMWALFNCLPAGKMQKPHRHQSIAIDVAVSGQPGCYTLMSPHIRPDGSLIDPKRFDWIPGGAFLTPPSWWHSHHNETGSDAYVFPMQDAGLHTWLRSLDIQFVT